MSDQQPHLDCMPAQYHGGLDKLWAATGLSSITEANKYAEENGIGTDVFSIVSHMLTAERKKWETLRTLAKLMDADERRLSNPPKD